MKETQTRPETIETAPSFIAYVYPGWHADPYRPNVDEWQLIDTFQPYFLGHTPPPRPLHGPYDDSHRTTADEQIALAENSGIRAFMYFTYYRPDEFIMSRPMRVAMEAVDQSKHDFDIASTWCIRLPHDQFPVPRRDALDVPAAPTAASGAILDDTLIELLTLRDLEQLGKLGSSSRLEAAIEDVVVDCPELNTLHTWGHEKARSGRGPTDIMGVETPAKPGARQILPCTLTLRKLRVVLEVLSELTTTSTGRVSNVADINDVVCAHGLGGLPLATIGRLVEAVRERAAQDVLAAFTLKQLEDLLNRIETS